MKKLCVSAMLNRIYDAQVSKVDPERMTSNRIDRTEEVLHAVVLWFNNADKENQESFLKSLRIKK